MPVARTKFGGSSFVGLYAAAADEYAIIAASSAEKFERAAKALGDKVIRASVASSPYIGVYTALNSNGIVLPPFCSQKEIEAFEKCGVNVEILADSKFCAIGNNVSCNNKRAIVNPDMPKADLRKIEDALGVEAVAVEICGYKTIGMMVVCTNKGFVAHNRISDDEMKNLEKILGAQGINSTVNSGTPMVGLGVVANSFGAVVGGDMSGFELSRVQQGLELID